VNSLALTAHLRDLT